MSNQRWYSQSKEQINNKTSGVLNLFYLASITMVFQDSRTAKAFKFNTFNTPTFVRHSIQHSTALH